MLDGTLTPTANPHAPELNITLLEVAGEVLQEGVSKGNMPSNVDIYFRAQNISKTFLILVPFTDTQQDDALVSSWLGNMLARNPMARNCPIILLLTKWDANPRAEQQNPSVVVQQNMVQTYNRLQHFSDFRIDAFSIGLIEQMQTPHRDANGQFINGSYTQNLDLQSAQRLWNALYRSFTGVELSPPPPPEKKKGLFEKLFGG